MGSFSSIVLMHIKRYPLMEIQDLYKLAYQAALGAEHAAMTQDAIHNYLMQELKGLTEGPEEPLVDQISPDERIVRIHLRPFIKKGGSPLHLSRVFSACAQNYQGEIGTMLCYWKELETMANGDGLPFTVKDLRTYLGDRQTSGYPPVHHSRVYSEAYKPAYRVILKKMLSDLFPRGY